MTGIIILAGGSSSRLGKPKQNLIYNDKTLLQNAIDAANASLGKPVLVVLGAKADVIKPTIESFPVKILHNQNWQEGMASSIRLGITEIKKIEPKVTSLILTLCDQPFVDAALINKLIQCKSEKGVVASAYNDTLGVPVLFDASYFDELLQLKGDEGAKKLLLKYPDDIVKIDFPLGSVDIDTIEDYEKISPS
jgi:molybdenum cofactor cytidylyltransferase